MVAMMYGDHSIGCKSLRCFTGVFCRVYLLFLAIFAGGITHTPLAPVVPGSQGSFFAVGALYRVFRVGGAIAGRGIGVKDDTRWLGSEAGRGKEYQGGRGRKFRQVHDRSLVIH